MRPALLVFCFFILIASGLMNAGCANIIPPTGGPRDSLPPKLLSVVPEENSRSFTEKKIVMTFDEYIELKDPQTSIIVSPVPKAAPAFEAHLKTLTIRLKDTLQPNTTYFIDFGNSLHDINEGNILKNFGYIFSTGRYIDSMQYSGNVILAATGKVDSTLVAMLYDNFDDSAVIKDRPRYITRLDTTGHFHFRYLRPGKYALYAMKDESGSHKYLSKAQLFAFADAPVTVGDTSTPVTLYAFADTSAGKTTTKKTVRPAQAPPPKKEPDKVKRLQFRLGLEDEKLDIQSSLDLLFTVPLKYFDSTKLRFTDDQYKDLPGGHWTLDSAKKKLALTYPWKMATSYKLILQKDFAEDTLGQHLLKIDTVTVLTKGENDYGRLRIRFTNLDLSRHPVLQFLQGESVRFSRPLRSNTFTDNLFLPGEYQLRILFDDNQNGVWDPGDFFKHRQPEKVMPLKQKLKVRADWDNEPDYIL